MTLRFITGRKVGKTQARIWVDKVRKYIWGIDFAKEGEDYTIINGKKVSK